MEKTVLIVLVAAVFGYACWLHWRTQQIASILQRSLATQIDLASTCKALAEATAAELLAAKAELEKRDRVIISILAWIQHTKESLAAGKAGGRLIQ